MPLIRRKLIYQPSSTNLIVEYRMVLNQQTMQSLPTLRKQFFYFTSETHKNIQHRDIEIKISFKEASPFAPNYNRFTPIHRYRREGSMLTLARASTAYLLRTAVNLG